ncbi:hypothetical protein BS17DRAFT_790440 [Gyrodon lividus]|nr:hypothetical protein BS17DRAFT_790440 [Gyrodon lividus]
MNKHAPILGKILLTAAQTDRATKNKNTVNDSSIACIMVHIIPANNCTLTYIFQMISKACKVMITQLAKQRSNHSLYAAAPFTLFLWTNGASRQTIETLAQCGLCISFTSLCALLNNLASQYLDRAMQVVIQDPVITFYLTFQNLGLSGVSSLIVSVLIRYPSHFETSENHCTGYYFDI